MTNGRPRKRAARFVSIDQRGDAVGDPQGSEDAGLRYVHFLAFPNVFTPPKASD